MKSRVLGIVLIVSSVCGCNLNKIVALAEAGAEPASSGGGSAATAGGEITFTKKDRPVGGVYEQSSTTDMKFTITRPKKLEHVELTKDGVKFELLAADGSRATKVKATYKTKTSTVTEDGKDKTKTNPVQGNSYIAEFVNGKIVVTDENKKKVGAEEDKTVASDVKGFLGKPDPLLSGIPGVPVKIGADANSIAEALRDILAEGDKSIELTGVSAKLKSIGQSGANKSGVFDVKLKATITEGQLKMVMDLTGTTTIRADNGHFVNVALAGPLTLGGEVDGAGSVKINVDYTE